MERRYLAKKAKFGHLKVDGYVKKLYSKLLLCLFTILLACCNQVTKVARSSISFSVSTRSHGFIDGYFNILTVEQQYGNEVTKVYFAVSTPDWPCDLGQVISVCCATVSVSKIVKQFFFFFVHLWMKKDRYCSVDLDFSVELL